MNYGIILFSGSSVRFNSQTQKQFIEINNKPLFLYSVDVFSSNKNIDALVLVTNVDKMDYVKSLLPRGNKPIYVINGGLTRKESSFNGLKKLKELGVDDNSKVLIHDAARVLITSKMIDECLEALNNNKSVTIARDVTSTITTIEGNYIDRNSLKEIETPQGFNFIDIYNAHINSNESTTDDTTLMKNAGIKTKLIIDNSLNIKVTTIEDLEIVKAILERRD